MKKKICSGVLAVVLTAVTGGAATAVAAERARRSWSIAVHLAYVDGSSYDYVLATGVSTEDLSSILSECGRSHRDGTVVRYHCYPIPE